MSYNDVLTTMSDQMVSAKAKADKHKKQTATVSQEDTISNLLNKIGLEVQRQGG